MIIKWGSNFCPSNLSLSQTSPLKDSEYRTFLPADAVALFVLFTNNR